MYWVGVQWNGSQSTETAGQYPGEGSVITFIVPDGGPHPLIVTEKYLRERPDWIIHPCKKCCRTELFDAPSDLLRVVFPNTSEGSIMEMFTAFCGACGGKQVVLHKDLEIEGNHQVGETHKKWWQFWR